MKLKNKKALKKKLLIRSIIKKVIKQKNIVPIKD